MNRFNQFLKWSWTFLVAVTLTLGLAGCDGDDGAAGATGAQGTPGADGQACWDLDGNGVGDVATEDINGDGVVDVLDCQEGADPIAAAVEKAEIESCATCHDGAGEFHQSLYDRYVDASTLTLTLNSVASVPGAVAGEFDVTLNFSITENGAPFVDVAGLPSLDQKRFYMVRWDVASGQYLQGNQRLREANAVPGAVAGDYVLTQTGMPYAPELTDAHVYGYIADGGLFSTDHGPGSEIPAGSHVHLYDNVANAALAFGAAAAGDANAYESVANVSGCENCHGSPYYKHGFRAAEVAGLPDFAACKSCHYDDRDGGHEEWQYMVDQPLNWATDALTDAEVEATYAYKANIMNDTHMSHAMEFPYPQSASNCSTCHAGKLALVLDDSNFTAETCKSCHSVQGIDAYPKTFDANGDEILGGRGGTSSVPEAYFQPYRAPALEWLWTPEGGYDDGDLSFHEAVIDSAAPDACTTCHGAAGIARAFTEIHTGYDASIYDATGTKYAALNTVSIDQVTRNGNLLTVNFSSNNLNIVPELLVSFYGWDSKHFIVASHTRDANGDRMEFAPGDINPLFTEDAASAPGDWMVTLDMAAYAPTEFLTDDIPTLIADGVIKKVEVSVTPELEVGGLDVVLSAVDATFDLDSNMIVADYFKGANSTVEIAKCNVCHDSLASSFHDGSGRAGDGIEVCKNCHVTTSPGSHIEMASRAIDSYTHAIHTFQDFDVGDTFEAFDPVLAARYDQHTKHVFPNFTIKNCEACHRDGTYDVPDQSKSMPGVLSRSDDVATWYEFIGDVVAEDPSGRNIGMVPEYVTGPASRACGACHRSRLINDDAAGDLASLNAHTDAFGTLVENDADDEVVYGVIDKIMSLFE